MFLLQVPACKICQEYLSRELVIPGLNDFPWECIGPESMIGQGALFDFDLFFEDPISWLEWTYRSGRWAECVHSWIVTLYHWYPIDTTHR